MKDSKRSDRELAEQLQYWGDEIENYDTMLVSLRGIIVKPLSLKYLAELEETS